MSLEILDRLSTGQLIETVFESSFGFTYVLFRAVDALYHENDDFGVRPCLHGVGDPGLVG